MSASIVRSARRLRFVALGALAIVLAVSLYAALAAANGTADGATFRIIGAGGGSRPIDLIVAAASGTLFAIGLWHLVRMLRRMEKGEFFTLGAIMDLRNFTLFLLLSALISVLLPGASEVASALSSQAPETRIDLTFDGGDFFALLVSGLLFFLARLLAEAQRIADDAAQIV